MTIDRRRGQSAPATRSSSTTAPARCTSATSARNFGKLYRSCGNCSTQYKRAVVIDNVTATSGKSLVGINTNYGDTARISRLTVTGAPASATSTPATARAPNHPRWERPDSTNCLYSSSDVTKR